MARTHLNHVMHSCDEKSSMPFKVTSNRTTFVPFLGDQNISWIYRQSFLSLLSIKLIIRNAGTRMKELPTLLLLLSRVSRVRLCVTP